MASGIDNADVTIVPPNNAQRPPYPAMIDPSQRFLHTLHEPPQRVQSPASLLNPFHILQLKLNPHIGDFQSLAILSPRRKQSPPATNDFLIRPAFRHRVIEQQDDVQRVVEHRKTSHVDSENPGQFLYRSSLRPSKTRSSLSLGVAQLLPLLSMLTTVPTQQRPPNTP